jgi:MFS family permease
MTDRSRLIPLIVACPLFLQNLDTSIMATALPSIARSLQVQTLHLNLAITSYLLSLAVFLPASGWLADRFGARRVFCTAIALFSLGSALCGLAQSMPQLVIFRVLQGMGGAMMVPVGRLILLRSVPPARMVAAMVWFTVPGAFGRLAGPLLGGLVVTITSWRWIFLLNIPFGVQ